MVRVSIDTAFYKSELLRMSVHVLRTIELQALEIFKAVVDCGGVTRATNARGMVGSFKGHP
jgi:hypothetical protein